MKQGLQGELSTSLAEYRPGWSLPRPFYRDETIYRADIEQIWRKGWLFAGHGSSRRIVCPYHQWTYDTKGALTFCRGMHDIDRAGFSLKKVQCETVDGL